MHLKTTRMSTRKKVFRLPDKYLKTPPRRKRKKTKNNPLRGFNVKNAREVISSFSSVPNEMEKSRQAGERNTSGTKRHRLQRKGEKNVQPAQNKYYVGGREKAKEK